MLFIVITLLGSIPSSHGATYILDEPLSVSAGTVTRSASTVINAWQAFPANNTIRIDIKNLLGGPWKFTVQWNAQLFIVFDYGPGPITFLTGSGVGGVAANTLTLTYPSAGVDPVLCVDYLAGCATSGGGGGGGGGGGSTPGSPVSSLFQSQGIGWLILVLIAYSFIIVTGGVVVSRRRRRHSS
jgi:hypothetical protein